MVFCKGIIIKVTIRTKCKTIFQEKYFLKELESKREREKNRWPYSEIFYN